MISAHPPPPMTSWPAGSARRRPTPATVAWTRWRWTSIRNCWPPCRFCASWTVPGHYDEVGTQATHQINIDRLFIFDAPTGLVVSHGVTCLDSTSCEDDVGVCLTEICDSGELPAGIPGTCTSAPDSCDDASQCTSNSCNTTTDSCESVSNSSCGIDGTVYYYRAGSFEPSTKPVPDVNVDLSLGLVSDGTGDAVTDAAGGYDFSAQAGTVNVSLMPQLGSSRAAQHNGAISSFDAARVAQYSVSLTSLSPHQVIASDVTNNGSVSSLDAARLAQFVVGLVDHFTVATDTGSDWRFLRCTSYPDESSPDCTDAVYVHDPLLQTETDDFFAVLYGDVTGNWMPAGSRSGEPLFEPGAVPVSGPDEPVPLNGLSLRAMTGTMPAPVEWDSSRPPAALSQAFGRGANGRDEVILRVADADAIVGLDLDLAYDPDRVRVVGIRTLDAARHFSVASNDANGHLRLGLFSPVALQGSGSFLSIEVKIDGKLRGAPFEIKALANEGQIPLRVRGGRTGKCMDDAACSESDRSR